MAVLLFCCPSGGSTYLADFLEAILETAKITTATEDIILKSVSQNKNQCVSKLNAPIRSARGERMKKGEGPVTKVTSLRIIDLYSSLNAQKR